MAAGMNGSASARSDAKTNGHIKTEPGSRAYRPPPPAVRRQGLFAWVFSQLLRIAVWYTIGTIILRCPKDISQLTDESPKLCKPYLQVHGFAKPYVQPYYDTHIQPHVQKVQPYIDEVQAKFIQPASTFAQTNYAKYGAPRVGKAQEFGQKQWESNVLPQLSVARQQAVKQYDASLGPYVQKADNAVRPYYTGLSTSAKDFWELEIQPAYKFASPYLQRGYNEGEKFFVEVALPYSQWINGVLWTAVNRHVFPTAKVLYGENVEPQIMRIKQRLGRYRDEKKVEAVISSASSSASSSSSAAAKTSSSSTSSMSSSIAASSSVAPSSTPSTASEPEKKAHEQFAADLDIWEQQVTRAVSEGAEHLKDRVADITKEQKQAQIKNVGESLVVQLEETESSGTRSVQKSIKSAVAGLPEDHSEDDVKLALKDVESEVRSAGKQVREKAQQIRAWRKNFDTETTTLIEAAANSTLETIDNIRELRLQEIGRRWASHDGITHRDWAHYNKLKKASGKWRDSIADIVNKHSGLSETRAEAADVEERAMAVAEDAAKELGRLKGVALWKLRAKDNSDDFTSKVVPPVVAKVKDQVVDAASVASEAILGSSQGTIESVTSAASSKASEAAASASEAVLGSSNSVIASASSLSKSIVDSSIVSAASSASSLSEQYFDGRSSAAEGLASEASSSFASATDKVLSGDASVIKQTASSMSSAASDMLSRASQELNDMPSAASKSAKAQASSVSESVVSLAGSSSEPTLSQASKSIESVVSSAASASPLSSASSIIDNVASSASSVSPISAASSVVSDASSSASSAVSEASSAISDSIPDGDEVKTKAAKATSRVFAGAMAQAVPNQQPIFDEPLDEDDRPNLDSFYEALGGFLGQADEISKAASEGIFGKTESNLAGTATSVATDLWNSVYDAASSAFHGPEPTDGGAREFLSAKYEDAVSAASKVVGAFTPTPTPTGYELAAKVQSQIDAFTDAAHAKWQENIAQVMSVSAAAASRISEQVSGTPKPIHEEMLQSVQDSYWQALEAARSKYDAVLTSTKQFQQATQAPYESISSVASENLAKALKQASAKYSDATSALGYSSTPGYQSAANEAQRQYYEGIGFAHDQYSSYVRYATRALQSAGLPFVAPTPAPYYETFLSNARVNYNAASASAASVLSEALASASSVAGATSTSPAQSVLDAASSQYDAAVSSASKLLYARQTPAYISYLHKAQSRHSDLQASASEVFQSAYTSALVAAGYSTASNPAFASATDAAWASYDSVLKGADGAVQRISKYAQTAIYGTQPDQIASASSRFSEMIYGSEAGWTDAVQTQAAQNWEAIVSKASEQVYGKPSPVYASITAQVTSAAAQATSAAVDQYSAVSSLFASLVSGQDADYTDKIFAQLSSAYYTGAANVASSVSSLADQATSAVASVFTAPPAIEEYLADVQRNIDAAVSAASVSLYGTPTGTVESATSAAASAASSAASQVSSSASDAFTIGLDAAKQAQMSVIAYAEDANNKIYTALFGEATPVPFTESVASQVSEAAAQASEALFGKEKEDVRTSAAKKLEAMIETARRQVEEYAEQASRTAAQGTEAVKETVQSVVERVRDEL